MASVERSVLYIYRFVPENWSFTGFMFIRWKLKRSRKRPSILKIERVRNFRYRIRAYVNKNKIRSTIKVDIVVRSFVGSVFKNNSENNISKDYFWLFIRNNVKTVNIFSKTFYRFSFKYIAARGSENVDNFRFVLTFKYRYNFRLYAIIKGFERKSYDRLTTNIEQIQNHHTNRHSSHGSSLHRWEMAKRNSHRMDTFEIP